jgi:hypothetical protein
MIVSESCRTLFRTMLGLPIAVEVVITVVETSAAVMVAVGNAEDTVDGADGAADTCADHATYGAAHRTGDPVTFGSTLLGSAHDALGRGEMRDRKPRQRDRGGREMEHERAADGQH